MYKLTYESEDDILDDNTENLTKKLDNEIIIYDKTEKHPTWTSDSQNNEKQKRAPSATSAAMSIQNSRKSSTEKKTNEKNFYSLFANNFPVEEPRKSKDIRWIGSCETCLLIFYLIALTAAVVVLFFYVKRVEDENLILKKHIFDLSHSGQSNTFDEAYLQRQNSEDCPGPHCCCNSTWKLLHETRTKLAKTSDLLGNLQKISLENFDDTGRQLFKIEEHIGNVTKLLTSEVKQVDANLDLQIFIDAEESRQKNRFLNKEPVAFGARRAELNLIDNHEIDNSVWMSFIDRSRITLSYTHSMINVGNGLNEKTGIFTATVDGVYVFHVRFCTSALNNVTVELLKNNVAARSFNTPIIGTDSVPYELSASLPTLPLLDTDYENNKELHHHHHVAILQLQKGDAIELSLVQGALVELDSRNGMETNSCTEFSGFLAN